MNGAAAFSSDYVQARARFREAAARAGFMLLAYPLAARGPHGEQLTIDVALKSVPRATRALVVSSGTHGVEGYFGSAVQLALLSERLLERSGPEPVSLVLIHAINPHGFAFKRRVNEDNVDQNRNFVLEGQSFSGAPPAYRALDPLLNPTRVPGPLDAFVLRLHVAALRHGFAALRNAIAQGQYEFPRGLFYGGAGPSQSQQILRTHLREWLGTPQRVLHLDLHTGLGKSASYALCVERPREHPRVARLEREFGARYVQGFDTRGVLYEIQGALGSWLEQCVPDVQYDCLLAEFGTYPALRVLAAMRLDNCLRQAGPAQGQLAARAQAELFEVFCPRSRRWRVRVVRRALRVVDQALSALSV